MKARHRLVLLVVAGIAAVGATGCAEPPRAQPESLPHGAAVPARPPDTGGLSDAAAAPVAPYARDAEGARLAALAFTRLSEELVSMPDTAAVAARRGMATAATAEVQAETFATELAQLRERWPAGALDYRVRPLATRVRPTEAGMRVEVWYVGVVSARGVDTYAEWGTDTYELVWESREWRVASLVETDGPTPAPGPQRASSTAEIEARLIGFEALP